MIGDLRTALHRLVDACVVYDETVGDEVARADTALRANIAAVLEHLDTGRDERRG